MTDAKPWEHAVADLATGVRLHYVIAGTGPRTIVLLHGFPQTWWAWRRIILGLAAEGYRVIAPDYRGAGHSGRPASGYDKQSMAGDIQALVRAHLGLTGPITIAGHDIGLMIGFAYATLFPDELSHLAVIDAPLPGTSVFDALRVDPYVWHFSFHAALDIPELLVQDRERLYLQHMFTTRSYDPFAISAADLDVYAQAYQVPGAMRAAFNLYRAFDRDRDDNRAMISRMGKLTVPVLAVGGDISFTGAHMEAMMAEVAINVKAIRVPKTGHWVAEENPVALVRSLTEFMG